MRETKARPTDPHTSHEAAAGQTDTKITDTQRRVLNAFRLYGNMTDAALVPALNRMERDAGMTRLTSPSAARSRRKELCDANERRMRQLRHDYYRDHKLLAVAYPPDYTKEVDAEEERAIDKVHRDAADEWARRTLRIEGFRSPLWNTGKVEKLATGYNAVVWGIAA